MPETPPDPPDDTTARREMNGLIAAMRGLREAATVDVPAAEAPTASVHGHEDELAAVAWRAMHASLGGSSGQDEGRADDEPAYLERGAVVGRYVVLRKLGAGGMGVVYAAYDPELDRKVALKLILPGRGDAEGRTRLLREAQALAKLSHRNVVAVHDVGTMGGQVWLAMEFVRGQTLREWLATPRSWQAVLGVLRKAGRGLAAAHAAGLLHRDFKPDNVMVGARGRVRVMDFGLARARPNAVPAADESTLETIPVLDVLATPVTQAGTLLGTPVYMAPEQLLGREPTPAVDQFALCVTLWEALYGERPFAGRTLDELVAAVIAGRVREPTRARGVPGWLRRACERGLRTQPQQRFGSMAELLDALANGQARARVRKGLAAVGCVALLGLGGVGYERWEEAQRVSMCEASGAEVETAWNAERRQALHDAFVATGVSYAPVTAEKVMPWLDRQAEAWREAREEACLDAEVRQRWSTETLDRARWCLDERRMELQSLVDELTLADAKVLQKAVPAAVGLAAVDPCLDDRVLELLVPPREEHGAVRAVQADMAWTDTLQRAGRYEKGLEVARGALERAEALQWRPISAAAQLRLGSLLDGTGAYAEAETALEAAYFAANEVAPEVAADASTHLVSLVGLRLARHAEGRRWARHAEAALERLPSDVRLRRADLCNNLGLVEKAAGAYDDAKRLQEQALAIHEQALGPDHLLVARSLNNLGNVLEATGAYDDAKRHYERALVIKEEALGPEHPDVAQGLGNLAIVYGVTGAYAESIARFERSQAIFEKALGPEHPNVAQVLHNLAFTHYTTGSYDEAKRLYERALAIREKVLDPKHPDVAATLGMLAILHMDAGAYEEAKALNERALAIEEAALGPEHPKVAATLDHLAMVYAATGAYGESKALHERALAIWEKAVGPEHPSVARTLTSLAIAHQTLGEHDEAKALHERALAIWEKAFGPEHPEVASGLSNLAQALMATGAYDEAKALHERALAIQEAALGADHPDVANGLYNLARVQRAMGAYTEAKASHERSLAILERARGPEHPDLAYPLVGLAEVAFAQRRLAEAVTLAERAVTVREKGGVAADLLAEARFSLARALWNAPADGGRDRARAERVAEQARDAFRDAGKGRAEDLAEVEAWLRER